MDEKVASAAELIGKLQGYLVDAKNDLQADKPSFYNVPGAKVFRMGRFIRTYVELMKLFNTKMKDDVIEGFEAIEAEEPELKLVEKFEKLLEDWDAFCHEIENNMEPQTDYPLQKTLPKDLAESDDFPIISKEGDFPRLSLKRIHENFRLKQSIQENEKSYVHIMLLRHAA